ncbi:phage tail protein [Aquabacter cavernae]|uniref:phage tail protein n=1 Tax=Aquabacter cavernae TaxID=2496029 RepID=UPI000F8D2D78|nr:tail fiber protein [Aquabacter cavernae]
MDPWLGEIRTFAFGYAPRGWLRCEGQLLQVRENAALFSILSTAFGGDGRQTFGLPDLRGRAIVGATLSGSGGAATYPVGAAPGQETVQLTEGQMPVHAHAVWVAQAGDSQPLPGGSYFAPVTQSKTFATVPVYGPPSNPLVPLRADTVSYEGGGVHNNMQPFSVLSFCIATQGLFPPRH